MSNKNTGGPAFPLETSTAFQNPGMTLRDYFAAKAMAAIILREGKDHFVVEEITITAYQYADSMLEVRET